MQALTRLIRYLRPRVARSRRPLRPYRPGLEALEDRTVPSGLLSVTGNFSGAAIPANDFIWFRSSAKVQGLGADPVTLNFTNQSIDFTANHTAYHLSVPDATLTLSPSETDAATTFDGTSWSTTGPTSFTGRVFVSGFGFAVPNRLPGNIHNVTWQAQVSTDTAGLKVNWEWAATVYRQFNSDMSQLDVQALDDQQPSGHRFYPAGTPTAYVQYITKGATDGMRVHDAQHFWQRVQVVAPATLSGVVVDLDSSTGLRGIPVNLTGTDNAGHTVNLWAFTAPDGTITFTGLAAGTYTLTEQAPGNLTDSQNTVGTAGGSSTSGPITGIVLSAGTNAQGYVFGDQFVTFG
jgi:hypothetical protein